MMKPVPYSSVFLLFAALLFFPFCLWAEDKKPEQKEAIDWYRADFPPVTIPAGSDAGQGFFDQVLDAIVQQLPGYDHRHHTANFKRIMREIRNKENACCPSLYKTPAREAFTAFSVAAMVVLPNGVVTRTDNQARLAPYLTADGKIELSRLIADSRLRLGISSGRVYSGGIDEILARHAGAGHIYVRSGQDVFEGLVTMLRFGRLDYIIGYPTEAQYFAGKTNRGFKLASYPIAENTIAFTLGHVGCPNTAWGREVIRRVDEVLLAGRHTPEFLAFYERWLDEGSVERYRRVAADFFRRDAP